MDTNDGGPAFPRPYMADNPGRGGMSLRDWFAGQALVGILAHQVTRCDKYSGRADFTASISYDVASEMAYSYADAMLAERNKEQQ